MSNGFSCTKIDRRTVCYILFVTYCMSHTRPGSWDSGNLLLKLMKISYFKYGHPNWDPKWFGFIKVAYFAIPISNGLNSTHSWYRIADSFGFTTTAVKIGIGCLKSVNRFWNSDNLLKEYGLSYGKSYGKSWSQWIPSLFSYCVSLKVLRRPCNQKCPRMIPVVHAYVSPTNASRNFLFVY